MFGIEIRKSGNIKNIYRDVDTILDQHSVERGEITHSIKVQSVAHALHDMIKPDKWLNVCVIDNCIKVSGICVSKKRYDVYSANHCISWNEMAPDYRELLIAMILDDFRELLDPNSTIIETTAVVEGE